MHEESSGTRIAPGSLWSSTEPGSTTATGRRCSPPNGGSVSTGGAPSTSIAQSLEVRCGSSRGSDSTTGGSAPVTSRGAGRRCPRGAGGPARPVARLRGAGRDPRSQLSQRLANEGSRVRGRSPTGPRRARSQSDERGNACGLRASGLRPVEASATGRAAAAKRRRWDSVPKSRARGFRPVEASAMIAAKAAALRDSCVRIRARDSELHKTSSSRMNVTSMFTWYSEMEPPSRRTCCS